MVRAWPLVSIAVRSFAAALYARMATAAPHAQLFLAVLRLNPFCALMALAAPPLQDALAAWRFLALPRLLINVGMEAARLLFSSAHPELPN